MNQLNSLILEGNVTRIPEMKQTTNGFKVCTIPLAVNRFYKNADGEKVEEVSFFDVETFGNMAEYSEKNCEKGRGVRVVGRLKQSRWKNPEGKNMSRVSIVAEHIAFKPHGTNAEKTEEKNALSDMAEAASAAADETENISETETEEAVF